MMLLIGKFVVAFIHEQTPQDFSTAFDVLDFASDKAES